MVAQAISDNSIDKKTLSLLLASKSPRRRQLLSQLGFPVRFVDIDVDETIDGSTPVELIAASLAMLKSKGFCGELKPDEILVTADTIVVHKGEVLGKPHDRDEAVSMLRSLSGDVNTVYTGVALKSLSRTVTFTERSDVFFRQLSEDVINHYVAQGTCMDKAGAYGIQEWIGMVGVERIEGCYYNVMGLPLSRIYKELSLFH